MTSGSAARRWSAALAEWRIPPEILAGAKRSPWVMPAATFAGRAREQLRRPYGLSYETAIDAMPEGGTVLDVGAGAGAASLPLRERAGSVVAVDESDRMLAMFADLAATAGIAATTVGGRWPDVAAAVASADVVVCHHVLYNVPDVGPFVEALTAHASRRVVVEMTARHPQSLLNPLWAALHGLARPDGPLAADAVAAVAETGVEPRWDAWRRPVTQDGLSWPELIDSTCRRLCLGPERRDDVGKALCEAGARPDRPYLGDAVRELVTIWWDV